MASFSEGLLGGMRTFTGGMRDLVASGDALERRKRERELAPIRKEILQVNAQQAQESYRQSVARGDVLPDQLQQGLTLGEQQITRGGLGIGQAQRQADVSKILQPGRLEQAGFDVAKQEYEISHRDAKEEGRTAAAEKTLQRDQLELTRPTREKAVKLQTKIQDFQLQQAETQFQGQQVERILQKADDEGRDLTPDEINQIDDLSEDIVKKSAAGAAYMMYNKNDPEGAKIMMERNLPEGTSLLNWDDGGATLQLQSGETVEIPAEELKNIADFYSQRGIEWDPDTATFYDQEGGRYSTSGRYPILDEDVPELIADTWSYRQQLPGVMKKLGMRKDKAGNFVDRFTGKKLLGKDEQPDAAFMRRRQQIMGQKMLQGKFAEEFFKAEGLEAIKAKYSGKSNPLGNFDFADASWTNKTMAKFFADNTDADGKLAPGAKERLDTHMLASAQQEQRYRADPVAALDQDIQQLENALTKTEAMVKSGAIQRDKNFNPLNVFSDEKDFIINPFRFDWGELKNVTDIKSQIRKLKAQRAAETDVKKTKDTEAFLSQPKSTEFNQMLKTDTKLIGDIDEWKNRHKANLDDEQKAQLTEISQTVRRGIPLTDPMREFLKDTLKSIPAHRETAKEAEEQRSLNYLKYFGQGI